MDKISDCLGNSHYAYALFVYNLKNTQPKKRISHALLNLNAAISTCGQYKNLDYEVSSQAQLVVYKNLFTNVCNKCVQRGLFQ